MPKDTTVVRAYFEKLGLEPAIADIYLTLHAFGPQTISELSRHANIERTRVYRLMETLTRHHLIETETHYKRTIIRAAPITNLQILLSEKEEELRSLQNQLEHVHRSLNHNALESPLTRVQFYRGGDGTKQMFWHQTKAKGETLSILYESMQTHTNLAYFERWVRKCNEEGLQFRGIISDHFLKSIQDWYGKHSNERLEHWTSRYVPPETFQLNHSMVTYDNVVCYYNWKDGEVFGIEIYNQEIADAQRSFFEMLWAQGQTVTDDLNWRIRNQP